MNTVGNAPKDATAREEVADLEQVVSTILLSVYPVGSIYLSVNNVNPSTLFGGTWVAWGSGKVPVGVDTSDTDFDTVEETGGTKSHKYTPQGSNGNVGATTLTAAQSGVPAHAHGLNSHKHSVGAHKHGIPQLSVSSWTGSHGHTITMYGYQAAAGGFPQGPQKAPTNAVDYDTLIGNTSITVSGQKTTASNTDNSTAFDTGAATGNTANNTAANASQSHTHSGSTFTGVESTQSHLQPYITCYMWKRTA